LFCFFYARESRDDAAIIFFPNVLFATPFSGSVSLPSHVISLSMNSLRIIEHNIKELDSFFLRYKALVEVHNAVPKIKHKSRAKHPQQDWTVRLFDSEQEVGLASKH